MRTSISSRTRIAIAVHPFFSVACLVSPVSVSRSCRSPPARPDALDIGTIERLLEQRARRPFASAVAIGDAAEPVFNRLASFRSLLIHRIHAIHRITHIIGMQIIGNDADVANWPAYDCASLAQPGEIMMEVQRCAARHIQRAMQMDAVQRFSALTRQKLEELVWWQRHAWRQLLFELWIAERTDDGASRLWRRRNILYRRCQQVTPPRACQRFHSLRRREPLVEQPGLDGLRCLIGRRIERAEAQHGLQVQSLAHRRQEIQEISELLTRSSERGNNLRRSVDERLKIAPACVPEAAARGIRIGKQQHAGLRQLRWIVLRAFGNEYVEIPVNVGLRPLLKLCGVMFGVQPGQQDAVEGPGWPALCLMAHPMPPHQSARLRRSEEHT